MVFRGSSIAPASSIVVWLRLAFSCQTPMQSPCPTGGARPVLGMPFRAVCLASYITRASKAVPKWQRTTSQMPEWRMSRPWWLALEVPGKSRNERGVPTLCCRSFCKRPHWRASSGRTGACHLHHSRRSVATAQRSCDVVGGNSRHHFFGCGKR